MVFSDNWVRNLYRVNFQQFVFQHCAINVQAAFLRVFIRNGKRNEFFALTLLEVDTKWNPMMQSHFLLNEGVVSKETVVLRRWGSSIQKFGFINGVDNVNWPPYRDSKS